MRRGLSFFAASLALSVSAFAAPDAGTGKVAAPDGGKVNEPPAAPAPVPALPKGACEEHLGESGERPKLKESFPATGWSGYELPLEVIVEHGKGDIVLPGGFAVRHGTDEEHALEHAGFYLPSSDGGAGPTVHIDAQGAQAKTTVKIPFVALPPKPGRHELTLPPMPIAIARASGAVITLCTEPHTIILEDPIANEPNAKPKRNPKAERQREEWTAAKNATVGALAALAAGSLIYWLVQRWRRRPKPLPPPVPARPPWEIAMEELFDLRNAHLIEQGRFTVHFDRVSHIVRQYLGRRYNFDGLESTTHEILSALDVIVPRVPVMAEVEAFLRTADLVKFAKLEPTEAECNTALERAEHIVDRTTPRLPVAPTPKSTANTEGTAP